MISKALNNRLQKLQNYDFQNRKGNYPKSDIPDSISVHIYSERTVIEFLFKNTSEDTASNFAKRFMAKNSDVIKLPKKLKVDFNTYQDGDYQDDWVICNCVIKD